MHKKKLSILRVFYFFNILNLARYKKLYIFALWLNLKNYNYEYGKRLTGFLQQLVE